MSHLIEKHQQNNKGRGVIRRKSLLSPEREAELKRQYQSYTAVPSSSTRVLSPRVQVAPENTPEKVSKRRIAVQTNKAFENAEKIDRQIREEQQYNQIRSQQRN